MLNAAAIAVLIDNGLSADAIYQVALALESDKPKSANALRQARFRERKNGDEGVTSNVTRNVTPPLKENSKTLGSEPNGSVVADPVKELIDMGVSMLVSQGHDERKARSLVGSWRKGRQTGEVVAALVDAKTRSISNLVEWMPKRLSTSEPPSYFETYRAAGAHP